MSFPTPDDLRQIPVSFPHRTALEYYNRERAKFRKHVIPRIPIDSDASVHKEPLISCQALGLKCRNYYYRNELLEDAPGATLYIASSDVRLRLSIAEDLLLIDQWLSGFGLRLFLRSGYRHPSLCEIIAQAMEAKKGKWKKGRALLADPNGHLPHATGAAIDLEIWDEETQNFLPTKLQGCGVDHFMLEDLSRELCVHEKTVRANRRLLYHILCSPYILPAKKCFIAHPFEYWHYSRHERLARIFDSGEHPVYYDMIRWPFY